MKLKAKIISNEKIKHHHDQRVRQSAGASVVLLPETITITRIGPRVDYIPEDLRFEEPQSILIKHLMMDEKTEAALNRAIINNCK